MATRIIRLSHLLLLYIIINISAYLLLQQGLEKNAESLFPFEEEESQIERQKLAQRKAAFFRYQQTEANRTGAGEHGDEVKLTKEEVALIESQMRAEGFSKYINSLVSLDRALDDYRHEECKKQHYPRDLPVASVIIIFRNELQRVVLRTVHSVINRTPPQYLKEVILVDDASDREELLQPLDEHIKEHWPEGHVKVIRLPTRSGLIRTRLAGVAAARGDVVIIMDGHMEATKGWIEPLLARIKENNKVLLTSLIDMIHPNNMLYIKSDIVYQSIQWSMVFSWIHLPANTVHDPLEPLPTYALVGCMMAMDKATFLEMGAFDTGMNLWGGENVELAIRMWMCGGRVEIIPCSRVAHTYRAGWGRPWKGSISNSLTHNAQRIAEVWLDEYKDEFYLVHQSLVKKSAEVRANVTDRLALRKRLGCKSFKWFLNEVVKPPMFTYTRNVTVWGQLKHLSSEKCLDLLKAEQHKPYTAGIYPCHSAQTMGDKQLFSLTKSRQLRRETHCLSFTHTKPGYNVTLSPDCQQNPTDWWSYDKKRQCIVHELSKLCLDVSPGSDPIQNVILNKCENKASQKWIWLTYNITDLVQPN